MGSCITNVLRGLILLLWSATAASATCSDDQVAFRGATNPVTFKVEVADSAAERSRGLMFRRSMPRDEGMLFVYRRPQSVSFWMKNTFIPLDLIFLDKTGTVQRVHENAVPGDLTPIPGGRGILVVLEINGGMAGPLGIRPGVQMQHPAFGKSSAWPCGSK